VFEIGDKKIGKKVIIIVHYKNQDMDTVQRKADEIKKKYEAKEEVGILILGVKTVLLVDEKGLEAILKDKGYFKELKK